MNIGNTVGKQIDDLIGDIRDARLLHRGRRASKLVHKRLKALWHQGARKLDRSFYLIGIGDRHNFRKDRSGNARLTDLIHKL